VLNLRELAEMADAEFLSRCPTYVFAQEIWIQKSLLSGSMQERVREDGMTFRKRAVRGGPGFRGPLLHNKTLLVKRPSPSQAREDLPLTCLGLSGVRAAVAAQARNDQPHTQAHASYGHDQGARFRNGNRLFRTRVRMMISREDTRRSCKHDQEASARCELRIAELHQKSPNEFVGLADPRLRGRAFDGERITGFALTAQLI
jgi:hypothetical protein